jgi:hypothetical protein
MCGGHFGHLHDDRWHLPFASLAVKEDAHASSRRPTTIGDLLTARGRLWLCILGTVRQALWGAMTRVRPVAIEDSLSCFRPRASRGRIGPSSSGSHTCARSSIMARSFSRSTSPRCADTTEIGSIEAFKTRHRRDAASICRDLHS